MRTRLMALGGAGVALAAVAWLTVRPDPPAQPPGSTVPTTTVAVTRGNVIQRVMVAGTVGFAGEHVVVNQLPPGILTGVPGPGSTVARGATLFTVSGTPVVLLYGASPAYRAFAAGMSDGPDVRQLEQNLVALGVDPGTVDDRFTRATAEAIRRWRRTATIPLGQVVFLPDAARVARTELAAGASVQPGTQVLSVTSTTRVVTVHLTTDRQHLLRVGNQVQVSLPGGGVVTGTVSEVGRVAATGPAGAAAPPGATQATVPVGIAVALPEGAGDLDQAPVQVAITTARRDGVLMVPVTALLAKVGGGYQVRVVEPGPARLVDVRPGLYDDTAGTVELGGAGLAEGMTVEVPAP